MGQVAGVTMVETVGASGAREDIAVGIEHGESIAMLERARTPLLQGGEGGDLKLLGRSRGQHLRLAQYGHGRLCHGEILRVVLSACNLQGRRLANEMEPLRPL